MKQRNESFAQDLDGLIAEFLAAARENETDADLASAALEFVLSFGRIQNQVAVGTEAAREVDRRTITKIKSWDSDDPALKVVESALRRLTDGRGVSAIKLLERAISLRVQEAAEARRRTQAEIAKRPRPSRQPMTSLVEKIVQMNPEVSINDLFIALKKTLVTMDDPPYSWSGNSFKSKDPRYPDLPRPSLRAYLSRAKKKVSR